MNVYDFDGTIYPSNCTLSFCLWCTRRQPELLVTYAPHAVKAMTLYKLGKMPKHRMLREIFRYLMLVEDSDEQVERFWDEHEKKIAPWYLAQKKPDDLIITASPDCIIAPIARRLGVNYVATEYYRELGVFMNNLMYAKEKSLYIIDHGFPVIDHFYSDSLSDTPLALCAEKAHLVTDGATRVVDWPELDEATMLKVKRKIDTGWKVHLED